MKKNSNLLVKSVIIIVFIALSSISISNAQNVAITDDDNYKAESSAMLDVKSLTKGFLVPRMTSKQIDFINSPATGLLVFNTEDNKYYFYNGSEWANLSAEGLWIINNGDIYAADKNSKVGIGVNSTNSKLEVKADASFGVNDTLFAVKDKYGNVVFAVFPDGARVYVDNTAKGNIGGFAVSGRNPTKGVEENYLHITPDSSRIYINSAAKGDIGGFAVSGRSPGKGILNSMFLSTPDSTRVYVNQNAKGDIGGFAVSGRSPAKTTLNNFLNLTKDNYFIGHRSGESITSGIRNAFVGYETGVENSSGKDNVFLGYQAGFSNSISESNIFIGTQAGYSNSIGAGGYYLDGDDNIFIGYKSGYNNNTGFRNIFIGSTCGFSNLTANYNVSIGYEAGYYNESGIQQVFVGDKAGKNTTGRMNTFLGAAAGVNNTSGQNNCFIGAISGSLCKSASNNTIIGNQAGFRQVVGDTIKQDNTIIGSKAGCSNSGSIGSGNVMLGRYSGYRSDTDLGDNNVFIGRYAGYNVAGSNQLIISNDQDNALIYGNFTDKTTTVSGSMCINGNVYNNKMNVYVGTSADGSSNGISFFENASFGMKLGYDGSSSGDNNRIHIYNNDNNPVFTVENGGNVGVGESNPTHLLQAGFAYCDGNTWTNGSDKNIKENYTDVDYNNILQGIAELPIHKWNYKTDDKNVIHIGPFAQDFYRIFKVGKNNTSLSTIDPSGVSLSGIKALIIKNSELEKKLENLQDKYDVLAKEIKEIKEKLPK